MDAGKSGGSSTSASAGASSKSSSGSSSGAGKTSSTGGAAKSASAGSASSSNSVAGSVTSNAKSGVANGNSAAATDAVNLSKDSTEKEVASSVNLDAWSEDSTATAAEKAEAQPDNDLAAALGEKSLKSGMHNESVRSLQSALNDKLGQELATDGKFGPKTRDAVKEFQRQNGLEADGIVGPDTRAALTGGGGKKTEAPGQEVKTDANGKPVDENTAPGELGEVSFGQKLSEEQKGAVNQMVDDLKAKGFDVKADDIINFMAVETGGTFSPSIRSGGKKSGAVGLAQFTGIAIEDMNRFRSADNQLTKGKLAAMNFSDQSKVVTEYLSTALGRKDMEGKEVSAADLYSAVFAPKAIGKPMDSTIYSSGSRSYRSNRSLDANQDGRITKAELTSRLNDWARRGEALRG